MTMCAHGWRSDERCPQCTGLCLGKLAARRAFGVSEFDAYLLGKPPAPPAEVAAPNVQWGVLGNDRFGDCTIAGAAHLIMAANAELSESDPAPDTARTVAQYETITGGQDTGCVEADVLSLWRTTGLFPVRHTETADVLTNKIAAYAPVDPHSVLAVHRAIWMTGTAYIGVQLPQSAMEQFQAGRPWTVVPGSPILGGHCILPVGYDAGGIWCVTWGQLAYVTWPWWVSNCDEVWAIVPQEAVEAGHGPGPDLDIPTLTADLNRLAA